MIDSIEIIQGKSGLISDVRFKQLTRVKEPESDVEGEDVLDHEFIDEWVEPPAEKEGRFKIRRFKMKPSLIVTLYFERHP